MFKNLLLFSVMVIVMVNSQSDSLSQSLLKIPFQDALTGSTNNSDSYGLLPVQCYYLEVENVSCVSCSWGGSCDLQTLLPNPPLPPPPTGCLSEEPPQFNIDRPGGDYKSIAALANNTVCQASCCGDPQCQAWVFVTSLQGTFLSCTENVSCCFLKSSQPAETPNNYPLGIWSGSVTQPPLPDIIVPPTGIRNAVPVGGLGAGTMELRGDGTFHEITIHSASPGGSAKYATQPDAMLSYKIGTSPARSIRTNPQGWAAPGVGQINYQGTYPTSKLNLVDPTTLGAAGLLADLYFYHHLRPNDAPTSSRPASIFTLSVSNAGTSATNISLMFQLPFGAMQSCQRVDFKPTSSISMPDYSSCMHACTENCGAWNFDSTTLVCELLPSAGRMIYSQGSYCGIQGSWDSSDEVMLTLSMHPGDTDSENGPASGDISLRPVNGVASSFGVSDDPTKLFQSFSSTGGFPSGLVNGVQGGFFSGIKAAHGAVTVTSPIIQPGETVSLSIVFSWYFPNRDYYGLNVGQFYSTQFGSSKDVATIYSNDHLVQVADDVAAHASVFSGPLANSLPNWLNDHMVNQFSHFRNFIFAAIGDASTDGRAGIMREHEANDCPDLDSVHNDYQRHLPYLWAVPDFEIQKSKLYEHCQIQSGSDTGMITENPGFRIQDGCGGRRMGDTTTLWMLEVLEIFLHTGNVSRVQEAWPAIVSAVNWSISMSIAQGLPAHLVCTYDILAMEAYNTTTFNGVLHLAMMKGAIVLASNPAINDTTTIARAEAAFSRGVEAMTTIMWNSTYGYFRAYTGGDAIMADCLYGQQVALAHGLGWLLPVDMITSHLEAEAKYNLNSFGLTVCTGRHKPPPESSEFTQLQESLLDYSGLVSTDAVALRKASKAADKRQLLQDLRGKGDGQDDAVWMGGAPTWSCLALALGSNGPSGGNVTLALEPTRLELENYRSRLNSMWDLTGLSTTDDWGSIDQNGQPFCTSHYAFMLTDYYLLYTLNGQKIDIPSGTLSFAPLYNCPFSLPFVALGREGTLSCANTNTYTLALAFGDLILPAGGLSVNGKAYPNAVSLSGGQSVTCAILFATSLSLCNVNLVEPNISPLHGLLSKPFVSRSRALRKGSDNEDTEQPILLSATSSISSGLILVLEQVKLTGSPPLVSRSDINLDVNFVPDFVHSGMSSLLLSPSPPIFFAASFDSLQTHQSPLRYARLTEDAVRDVILAIISSPGRPWSSEAEDAMKEFNHKAPLRNEGDKSLTHLFCRAGPVTAPYWCLSSLLSSRPQLFRKEIQTSKVYIIDAGATLAGYFGLLAAASAAGVNGVHTLVIDPQPQCIEWARSAAAASGFSKSRFSAINALLMGSKDNHQKEGNDFIRVPTVTNCRGSTTQGGFIDSIGPLNASTGFVSVPRQSLSEILKNEEDATILLLKLDAIGREKEVLDGLGPYLDAQKVLNVILELNKQRLASFLKLPSALKAEEKLIMSTSLYTRDLKEFEQEAVDAGALPSQAAGEAHGVLLSDEDNTIISKLYAELISNVFLDRGFECLTADRGWWSAQSPFRQGEEATQDGETLEKWANKMSRGSEVDLWCWLPAVRSV